MRTEVVLLHGHRLSVRVGGTTGPVLLLLHGLLGSGASFGPALDELSRTHRVIAPDLLGHGASAKPSGDYSLGSLATLVRDLLVVLGVESATVVGHSLGGGVAMQLAYQFPATVERLVLVSSGGLGRTVSPALRAVALPGAEWVLPAVFNPYATRAAGRLLRPLQRFAPPALTQMVVGLATLADAEARAAFVQTARSVIDVGGPAGQRHRPAVPRCGAAPAAGLGWPRPGHPGRPRRRAARTAARQPAGRSSSGPGTSRRSRSPAGSPASSPTS